MKLSKNLIYLIVCTLLTAITIFSICYYSMNTNFDNSFKEKLQTLANVVDTYVKNDKYRMRLEVATLADSTLAKRGYLYNAEEFHDEFVKYVMQIHDVNFVILVDTNGIVLARGHLPTKGDRISSKPLRKALSGSVSSDIASLENAGLTICAAAPIYIDKKIVGALIIGDAFKNNYFVDNIKKITNIDMTIFDHDTRISTTLLHDGRRAVGTKLENYKGISDIIQKDDVFNDDVDIFDIPYKAIYWPIIDSDGDTLGIWFLGNNAHEARKSIVTSSFICLIVTIIASVIMCFLSIHFVRELVNPLQKKSVTDKLTGILNRHGLESYFDVSFMDQGMTGALILIDLDHFKEVNDTLGHPAGDHVLRRTADELKRFFRNSDIVARMGGDEFVVYAPSLNDTNVIKTKMRQLVKILKYGYNLGGNDILLITPSIGISICPKDGGNYKTLYDNADKALYQIKETGRNGFAIFGEGRCQ